MCRRGHGEHQTGVCADRGSKQGHCRRPLAKAGLVYLLIQTHVCDLHDGQQLFRRTHQHILRLQVPVTLLEVQVLDGRGDLEEVQSSLRLVQLCLLDDLVEQIPALCRVIGRVNHILQVYDSRVVHQLKDHVGGAVATVEGGDTLQTPSPGPCSQCTCWSTREGSCQRWPPST